MIASSLETEWVNVLHDDDEPNHRKVNFEIFCIPKRHLKDEFGTFLGVYRLLTQVTSVRYVHSSDVGVLFAYLFIRKRVEFFGNDWGQ